MQVQNGNQQQRTKGRSNFEELLTRLDMSMTTFNHCVTLELLVLSVLFVVLRFTSHLTRDLLKEYSFTCYAGSHCPPY
jgi:hypothetical protein